jgi:hypothetical protein
VDVLKVANSTCAGQRVDAAVKAHAASCFDACPPTDRDDKASACYSVCYATAINGNTTATPPIKAMSRDAVVAPFLAAFKSDDPADGGCPSLHPPTEYAVHP